MDAVFIAVLIGVLGLIFGSFAGATVWRLRARQLREDKRDGEPYDKQEYTRLLPLTQPSLTDDRSRCLECGHELAWYDLVPLVSWVATGGKCRYCRKPIGAFEPLMEIGTATLLVSLFVLWPFSLDSGLETTRLGLWLVAGVILAVLFAYDLKWFLLPNLPVFFLAVIGTMVSVITVILSSNPVETVFSIIGAVMILSGIYAVLWLISRGAWIGFGDVKLGLGLALLLADWRLAFIALFTANLLGCLIILPGALRGKVSRSTRVSFGPLLIAGSVISLLVGRIIIDWYWSFL